MLEKGATLAKCEENATIAVSVSIPVLMCSTKGPQLSCTKTYLCSCVIHKKAILIPESLHGLSICPYSKKLFLPYGQTK